MTNIPTQKTNYGALSTLTLVFFFWGFIAAGNSVFIPFCKDYFQLDQFQSMLIDFAFYGAYYLGALGLFVFGSFRGKDLVGTWGYKKSIVFGLIFSALGAAAMIFSVYQNVFTGMLLGLFIVALGFSLQQTSANPFMIALGDEATGSNRINLGGGINSLGTTIGPLVISLALFGSSAALTPEMIQSLDLWKVIVLYACVGGLFLGVAALFGFSKRVPDGKNEEKQEPAKKAVASLLVITGLLIACFSPVFSSYTSREAITIEKNNTRIASINKEINRACETLNINKETMGEEKFQQYREEHFPEKIQAISSLEKASNVLKGPLEKWRMVWLSVALLVVLFGLLFIYLRSQVKSEGWGAMQFPQLTLGMLAIFIYVGVEVAIGSNLGELLGQDSFGGYSSSEIAPFIAMFWGSLMIGRWAGAINAFEMKNSTKQLLRFVVPLIAFGIVLGLSTLSGYDVQPLYWYIICVLVQIAAFYITNDRPALTLGVFGALGIIAITIGLLSTGTTTIYAFLSGGLFCSIMWPCIFSLSLAGLGNYQTQGSAFLVMMILGGAIIPPLQGKLSDVIGIQTSFVVALICFVYLMFFALFVRQLLKRRGITFE